MGPRAFVVDLALGAMGRKRTEIEGRMDKMIGASLKVTCFDRDACTTCVVVQAEVEVKGGR